MSDAECEKLLERCLSIIEHLPTEARQALKGYRLLALGEIVGGREGFVAARHYPRGWQGLSQGVILFVTPWVVRLSARGLVLLVAHESAHACASAEGSPDSEENANARMARWGLNPDELQCEMNRILDELSL